MNNLKSLFRHHNVQKSDIHGDLYDRIFHTMRDKKIVFLEIGVYQGGSMRAWSDYFSEAAIYGLDNYAAISKDISEEIENVGRAVIFKGQQEDEKILKRIIDQVCGIFDVIIDDGGHQSLQIETSFKVLFPFLASDGLYIIEDLHLAPQTIEFIESSDLNYKFCEGYDNFDKDICVIRKKGAIKSQKIH